MFWNPFHSFNALRFPCHKMRAFLQLKTSLPQWRTTSQGLARPAPAQCFKNDNLAWMVSVPGDLCMLILKLMMRIMNRFVGQTPNVRSCRVYPGGKRPACCAPRGVSDHSAQPCCGAQHVHQISTWASFVNKVVCWSMIPRSVQCRCQAKAHQTLAWSKIRTKIHHIESPEPNIFNECGTRCAALSRMLNNTWYQNIAHYSCKFIHP